jgi:hypothetical protein
VAVTKIILVNNNNCDSKALKLNFSTSIYRMSEKDCTFFKNVLLFCGRHLENFVPTGTAGISIKSMSI